MHADREFLDRNDCTNLITHMQRLRLLHDLPFQHLRTGPQAMPMRERLRDRLTGLI
jgi:hypothetical protein